MAESIRFAQESDIASIVAMLGDPEVGRWLWFTPGPPEFFDAFFRPLIESQTKSLDEGAEPDTAVFVVDGEDGGFLGQGAVVPVMGSPDGFEIGFQLPRAAWGRGIGTRLGRYLCAYAVHKRHAYRIEGACLEGNAASASILAGLGLQLEGTRRGYRLRDGVRHTELHYGACVSELDLDAIGETARGHGL